MARAMPGTTDRIIALLRRVAEAADGLTLSELSRALDLAPSTIHRMVDRLGALGIVRLGEDGRHYVAGLEFYRLAALVVARTEITQIAGQALDELAVETGETCFLALYMPDDRRMMYDARAAGAGSIQVAVELHRLHAMTHGAAALAMLSTLTPLEVDTVLSGDEALSAPRAALFDALAGIRRAGYAISHDARIADAVEIAAPVRGAAGHMVGALSVAIPSAGFEADGEPLFARQVIDRAIRLSDRLGDPLGDPRRRRIKGWTMKD